MCNFSRRGLIHVILFAAAALPLRLQAEGVPDQSVQFSGQITPFLSGSAGSGAAAPDYSDAFSTGIGGSVEYHRRMSERYTLLGGVGYEKYSGETYRDIAFEDQDRLALYGGAKIHFMEASSGLQPYMRFDLGGARLSAVNVSHGGTSAEYWKSSWTLLADAGVGVEQRFDDWSLFGELLLRYEGEPDSSLGPPANADGSWSLPLRVGVGYHF